MKAKIVSLNTLLYVALILALLSSLNHVALAFATTNGNNWIEAYVSAVAIDLGLLALAAGINKRKISQRTTWTLWGGVVVFSIISTYANWLSGIIHVMPLAPDVGSIGKWLVSLRPILLSGVLPLLVIYLSEIVSGNYQLELTEAQRQAKKVSREHVPTVSNSQIEPINQPGVDTLIQAREAKQALIDERRVEVLSRLQKGMSQPAIADELKVSLATVKRDTAKLNGVAREVIP